MKSVIAIVFSLAVVGCSTTGSGQYRYCSAASVNDPAWYTAIKDDNIVTKFGVDHTREAERDVVRVAQLMLAQQLYSRVSGSTTLVDGRLERSSQYSKVASNVYLDSAKVEWSVENGCMVAWAGVTMADAERSLQASLEINKQERLAWARVRNTYSVSLLERHVQEYPLGIYREQAEDRIARLEQGQRRERIRDSRLMPGAKLLLNGLASLFGD